MSYVIYNKETTVTIKYCVSHRSWFTKEFESVKSAKSYLTRLVNQGRILRRDEFNIEDSNVFYSQIEEQVTKRNMMTDNEFKIGINAPLCIDPSSETYWCM